MWAAYAPPTSEVAHDPERPPAPAPGQTHIRSLRGAAAPTSRLRRVRAQEDETILRIGFPKPSSLSVRPPGSAGTDQAPVNGEEGSAVSAFSAVRRGSRKAGK